MTEIEQALICKVCKATTDVKFIDEPVIVIPDKHEATLCEDHYLDTDATMNN